MTLDSPLTAILRAEGVSMIAVGTVLSTEGVGPPPERIRAYGEYIVIEVG